MKDYEDWLFDVAQHVVNSSGGLTSASTAIDDSALSSMRDTVEAMDMAAIFGLFFQVLLKNKNEILMGHSTDVQSSNVIAPYV